ncbi:MAG TPA: 50S ribosomal protein L4 [Planctomycetaceae bacterium]|jgi:large subunit ribosomal protein L4|nr:50S ribosomal protein L4 [Planctomycetaceae bacterium]
MISLPIHNRAGQAVGTYEFDETELAADVNRQLLHDVIVMYETNRRVGTVQTKGRADVQGSKKKMYRQKGTGRARMGNKRTPIRRGGGHTFGKRPVDWTYRLPRKAVALATRMALLSKFRDNEVTILDELTIATPKTKDVVAVLKALGLSDKSCLLTIDQHDANVWKSARNIPTLAVSPASDLNAYELLHKKSLLVTKGALDRIRSAKTKKAKGEAE